MARISIYVPDGLKTQMDQVDQEFNWSETACRAFEEKLAQLAARRKEIDMETVIQRLRVSKERNTDELFEEGFAAGKEWAMRWAEAGELEALDSAAAGTPEEDLFTDDPHAAYGAGQQFVCAIDPDSEGDRQVADDFWGRALREPGERPFKASFVNGFAAGALDVWRRVGPEL